MLHSSCEKCDLLLQCYTVRNSENQAGEPESPMVYGAVICWMAIDPNQKTSSTNRIKENNIPNIAYLIFSNDDLGNSGVGFINKKSSFVKKTCFTMLGILL